MPAKRFAYQHMLVSPQVGGAAKLAFEIQRATVAERGPVSRLLIPGGGDAECVAIADSFDYDTYDLDRLVAPSRLSTLLASASLYAKLQRGAPGILHIHSPFVYGALVPLLSVVNLKTVLHIHLDYSVEQLSWPLRSPPDLILLSAKSIRPPVDAALANASKSPKLHVIQNAVDIAKFHPGDRAATKAKLGLDPACPLIVMIANLAPHKGQATAIRAMSTLTKQSVSAKLWIVGEERDRSQRFTEHLGSMVDALGVRSQVEFLGFRNDIPEIMRAADFMLLPSTSETLSLVVLEAQASKVVVLAAPVADLPEVVINDKTGYLIPHDDPDAYAARLAELIRNPQLKESFAENAFRAVTSKHRMSDYCRAVIEQYDELLPAAAAQAPR